MSREDVGREDVGRDAGGGAADRLHRLHASSVFCMAPWTQLHVLPTGEVFVCCMAAEPRDAIGNLRQGDTLASSWNAPAMRALRRDMLAERPSERCHLCYAGERVGQSSLRKAENYRMASHYDAVMRTAADGTLDPFRVPTLDLRFSNVCNLRCRICSAKLSSAWHADAVALGLVSPSQRALHTATDDPDVLLQQVLALLPHAERLHFAGGEPLLSTDHYHVVESIVPQRRGVVQLSYNTNFSTLTFRHWDAIELWRAFPNVSLQASLDGMGARGELMRKGLDWDAAVANRRRLLAECPHVVFVVHATVSALNALHLPEFYRSWLEDGLITPGGMQLNILHGPPQYNVRSLPGDLKDRVERVYDEHAKLLATLGDAAASVRRDFEAVIRYMRAEDWDLTDEFRARTRELDVLRAESLATTFPELAEWIAESSPSERVRSLRVRERLQRDGDVVGDLDRLVAELQGREDAESRRALSQARRMRARHAHLSGRPAASSAGPPPASAPGINAGDSKPLAGTGAMPDTTDAVHDAGSHYALARQQRRAGDAAGALDNLSRAVERAPAESIAWLTRRLAEIEEEPDALLDDEGGPHRDLLANPATVYFLRGLAWRAHGEMAAARADFDRVTALEPLLRAAAAARASLDPPPS